MITFPVRVNKDFFDFLNNLNHNLHLLNIIKVDIKKSKEVSHVVNFFKENPETYKQLLNFIGEKINVR